MAGTDTATWWNDGKSAVHAIIGQAIGYSPLVQYEFKVRFSLRYTNRFKILSASELPSKDSNGLSDPYITSNFACNLLLKICYY